MQKFRFAWYPTTEESLHWENVDINAKTLEDAAAKMAELGAPSLGYLLASDKVQQIGVEEYLDADRIENIECLKPYI